MDTPSEEHMMKIKELIEEDPFGKDQHEPGAKLDDNKIRFNMVMSGFPRALEAVAVVGTGGAKKYTPNGWMKVSDGYERYSDAAMRHKNVHDRGELYDPDTGLLHLAQEAWNKLAALELYLRDNTIYGPIYKECSPKEDYWINIKI